MKRSLIGIALALSLFLAPLAHADTGYVPIGDPYTDTLQLWGEVASVFASLGHDFTSLFDGRQPTAINSPNNSQRNSVSLAAAVTSFNNPPQTAPATSSETAPNATSDQATLSQNVKTAEFSSPKSTTPNSTNVIEAEPAFNASNFVTQSELAYVLLALSNSFSIKSAPTTAPAVPLADGNPIVPYAAENNITNLSNVTITNANLSASEIPALNYFPATSTVSVGYGGTGTSNAPSYGQLLLGNGDGGYTLTATSSLGILSGSSLLPSANVWSALNIFTGGASTTNFSNFGNAYFGGTATSSFNSAGALDLNGLGTFSDGFVSQASSTVAGNFTTSSTITAPSVVIGSGSTASGLYLHTGINPTTTLTPTFYDSNAASGSVTSGPAYYNELAINSDTVNASGDSGQGAIGFYVGHNFGGAGATGYRTAFQSDLYMTAQTGNGAGNHDFYVAQGSLAQANANDSGTSVTPAGNLFGFDTQAILTGSATYWNSVVGAEDDIAIKSGGSAAYKIGSQIVQLSTDSATGSIMDAGLVFGNQSGGTPPPGWNVGISFGSALGWWPIQSTGTLIGTISPLAGSPAYSAAYGINLSGVTFTTAFLNSNGFTVDGVGSTTLSSLNDTGNGAIAGTLSIKGSSGTTTIASGQGVAIGSSQFVVQQGTGNVGIGTQVPQNNLNIYASSGNSLLRIQDAATTNGANAGLYVGLLGGNNAYIMNQQNAQVVLGTDNLTRMTIGAAGSIGIGTTTAYAPLSVWGADSASSTLAFNVVNSASTTVFSVFDGGNAELSGSLSQSSDQRLKTNIQSLDASSSLSFIDELNPVTFNWIDPNQTTALQLGFIAQQVQQLFPNLVSTTSATALTPGGTLSLNYIGLISPIVSAIQELSADIASIENTIAGFAQSITSARGNFTDQLCVGSTCVTPAEFQAMVAAANAPQSSGQGSGGAASDDAQATDTPPVIQINGDNPAIIQAGATYNDLGATITGLQQDLNLGFTTYVNGAEMSPVQIDTSQAATDTIDYVAIEQNGLTSTSTRTVIIEAPSSPGNTASSSTTPDTSTIEATTTDTSATTQ